MKPKQGAIFLYAAFFLNPLSPNSDMNQICHHYNKGLVGIVSKEIAAASAGNWNTINWDNQTNWLSKLYHRKVKKGVT